jgi:hypothetical protein
MTTQFTTTTKPSPRRRTAYALAAIAAASLFIADIAPAIAQQAPGGPSRTGGSSSTMPGGPNRGGDGGMPSISCNDFGYANMPSGCLSQAMACVCPSEMTVNYQAPSSCEGVGRNMRRAAAQHCTPHTGALRPVL